jgi:hypothetical protein
LPLFEKVSIYDNKKVPDPCFVLGGSYSMYRLMMAGAISAAALFLGAAVAGDALKSGPQPGSRKIPPFNPEHANGPNEGEKLCLV